MIDNSGSIQYYYDNMGNIIEEVKKIEGDDAYTNKMGYDALGKITNFIYPDGEYLRYKYNKSGQLNKIDNKANNIYIKNMVYDMYGQRIRVTNGNGTETEYKYNELTRRLEEIKTKKENTVYQFVEYKFDRVGNVLSITDKVHNNIVEYDYDSLHRLEKYTFNQYDDNTFTTLIDTQSKEYSYNSIGNMMFKEGVGAYIYGENTAGPHAVTTAGDYRFDYDQNGNMLYKGNFVTQQTNFYKWDIDNRLSKVSNNISGNKVEFIYDYTGKRVKKINDVSGDTIYASSFYEIAPSGTITKHIFDGVRRIVSCQKIDANPANDTKYWFHTDHLGSTGLLTKDDGTVIQETTYYPFGETRTNVGETNTHYLFTGQEFDPETGLYYYNARYYDPTLARFMSADTMIPYPFDPQSFSRYTYTRNNPIVYIDPSGHSFLGGLIVGLAYSALKYVLNEYEKWLEDDDEDRPEENRNYYFGTTGGFGEGTEPDHYYTDPTTGSGGSYNEEPIGNDINEVIQDYNTQQEYQEYLNQQMFDNIINILQKMAEREEIIFESYRSLDPLNSPGMERRDLETWVFAFIGGLVIVEATGIKVVAATISLSVKAIGTGYDIYYRILFGTAGGRKVSQGIRYILNLLSNDPNGSTIDIKPNYTREVLRNSQRVIINMNK